MREAAEQADEGIVETPVSFEEAQAAFLHEEALIIEDPDHSEIEYRFILLEA